MDDLRCPVCGSSQVVLDTSKTISGFYKGRCRSCKANLHFHPETHKWEVEVTSFSRVWLPIHLVRWIDEQIENKRFHNYVHAMEYALNNLYRKEASLNPQI